MAVGGGLNKNINFQNMQWKKMELKKKIKSEKKIKNDSWGWTKQKSQFSKYAIKKQPQIASFFFFEILEREKYHF